MERRSFLGGLAGTPLAAGRGSAQTGTPRRRPPNVLFILFDKCRRDAFGAYGMKPVHTPNIDALAQDGVRFDTYYARRACADPAALPSSRACIRTSTACARTVTLPTDGARTRTTDAIPIPFTTSAFISGTTSPMSCTMPATRRPTSASGTWDPRIPAFRYLADLQLADVPLDRQAARVGLSSRHADRPGHRVHQRECGAAVLSLSVVLSAASSVGPAQEILRALSGQESRAEGLLRVRHEPGLERRTAGGNPQKEKDP